MNSEATHHPLSSVEEQQENQSCLCTPVKDTPSERIRGASHNEEEVKGEQIELVSSQITADLRTPIRNGRADEVIESTRVCAIDDGHTQTNSQTRLSTSSSTPQTIQERIKADKSTQWSPITVATKDSTSIDTQLALQCNTGEATIATGTQMETSTVQTHLTLLKDDLNKPHATGTLTKRMMQTDEIGQNAGTIDKLKKEVERLEGELGMAQSTLVWQSLMMRLHQI